MDKVYITSALRTAVGSLGKTLKNIPADILGSAVISEVIKKSNLTIVVNKNVETNETKIFSDSSFLLSEGFHKNFSIKANLAFIFLS